MGHLRARSGDRAYSTMCLDDGVERLSLAPTVSSHWNNVFQSLEDALCLCALVPASLNPSPKNQPFWFSGRGGCRGIRGFDGGWRFRAGRPGSRKVQCSGRLRF